MARPDAPCAAGLAFKSCDKGSRCRKRASSRFNMSSNAAAVIPNPMMSFWVVDVATGIARAGIEKRIASGGRAAMACVWGGFQMHKLQNTGVVRRSPHPAREGAVDLPQEVAIRFTHLFQNTQTPSFQKRAKFCAANLGPLSGTPLSRRCVGSQSGVPARAFPQLALGYGLAGMTGFGCFGIDV